MPEFKSILHKELYAFLSVRKETTSGFSFQHACHILQGFDSYLCGAGCSDKNLTEGEIYGWLKSLGGKSSTRASYVSLVRVFLKHLAGYGFHPFIPSGITADDDYVAYVFSDDEVRRIFSIADSMELASAKYPCLHLSYPVILRLLYGCGLRLGEAVSLQMKDADLRNGVLTLKRTKLYKERHVPMHPGLNDILRRYCEAVGVSSMPEAYIFPGTDFYHLLPSHNVRGKFNLTLEKAGISYPGREKHGRGPCLHCFRHTFAFQSFRNGESAGWGSADQVPWLSIYLGHNSLRETEKYLKFNCEMYPEAMQLFHSYSQDVFPEVDFHE